MKDYGRGYPHVCLCVSRCACVFVSIGVCVMCLRVSVFVRVCVLVLSYFIVSSWIHKGLKSCSDSQPDQHVEITGSL